MAIKSDSNQRRHGTLREPVNPYSPPGPKPNVLEEFDGIDTSTSRAGVDDKKCWWIDGFMPIGRRLLRTMYGVGSTIYTAPAGTSIVFFDFANIGTTRICIVILSNGRIDQVNTSTLVVTQMAAAGTITNPSRVSAGMCQWGNQYVIIVADQTNGYFIWDGSVLYKAGSLAPQVTLTNVGSGYTSAPTVAASGGSGTGATFVATVSNGVVTGVTITNPGSGYLAGDTVTLGFSGGGGSGAAGTVTLMPYGVSGDCVETYSSRAWVANGPIVSYTAPGSVSNFATSAGGGNFTASDPFLRVGYVELRQTNGFLYLIADSSINYISGVQTTGTPPTTTFTNQNADPEVGTPWPGTVDVWGRNIVFANSFGVHVSYGAAVTKISDPLDGVYNTVPSFGGFLPSAAKAIVFGKKLWNLLLPIVDPVTGETVRKIFCWDGKLWWATGQDFDLTFIQHQEIDSVLTAFGTNSASIFPLFSQPSTNFTKTVQSKLWDEPGGIEFTKTAGRVWGAVQYYSIDSPEVRLKIDNERNSSDVDTNFTPNPLTWMNNTGHTIEWINNSSVPITWYSSGTGLSVLPPTKCAQNGQFMGMTAQTEGADLALVTLQYQPEIAGYRG